MTQRQTDVNGWFEVKRNPLSRVGVFPYRGASVGLTGPDADRIIRVLRPEEELADPECLESFKLLPWVDEHAMLGDGNGLLPAEVKGVQGVIGEEVFYDSGVLYGNIKVFSEALRRLIEAGKKQLSAGYRCVYDFTSGVWNGQPYDAVQRTIRGNHLALVPEGRMGPAVAVMDRLTFTFDAQEATPMADPKDNAGGEAGDLTVPQLAAMMKTLAPQVAALQEAMNAMQGAPATPEVPGGAEDDTKPPVAAAAAPAAAAPASPAAPAAAQDVGAAMDAALKPMREQIATIAKTVSAMDAAIKGMPVTVAQDNAARNKLADRVANVVGTFDHADKSVAQVAAYACEKFGLKPAAGAEVLAVEAYLQGVESRADSRTVRTGLDAAIPKADSAVSRWIDGK